MIAISDALKSAIMEQKNYLRITFTSDGIAYTITNANIIDGSFYVSRFAFPDGYYQLGAAVSAECGFTLFNDGTYDNVGLVGNEMQVEIGAYVGSTLTYFTLGYFTPVEAKRDDGAIEVIAYDRLIKFNAQANITITEFETYSDILTAICNAVGVQKGFSSFANDSQMVLALDTTYLTYGNILHWITALAGAYAYVDSAGVLQFGYIGNTITNIDNSVRMQGTGQSDDDITITGVRLTQIYIDPDTSRQMTQTFLSGSEGYVLDIYDNGLAQVGSMQTIVNNVWTALGGASFSYTPFECSTLPMPWLMPLDAVAYTTRKGTSASASFITDLNYQLNGEMQVCARGLSVEEYNNTSGTRNQANALSNINNVGAYLETETYNSEVRAHFVFSATGLKISGTAGASDNDFVNISATEQTFNTDGQERLKLNSLGMETQGRVKADEGIVIGNYKIAVINGQLCDVEA